jgi:hypothetical protein
VAVRKKQQQLLIKPYLGFLLANLVWEKRIGAGFYQGSYSFVSLSVVYHPHNVHKKKIHADLYPRWRWIWELHYGIS